jgi:hypothetical protein
MSNPNPLPSPATQFARGGQQNRFAPVKQLVACQRALMVDVLNPDTKPGARASCARVVMLIEQQKRAMRMLPTPKPAEVPAPNIKRKPQVGTEPTFAPRPGVTELPKRG